MKPGWFDAFRTDGGPTLYSYSNRTPVTGDVQTITLYLIFFTVFLAFLVIFPGVRKERFTTFTSVTLSLFVGTVILVARYGSSWHVAETQVLSSYRAFSRERLEARLGAYIGLNHVNITLRAMPVGNRSEDIDFNERFVWLAPGEMGAGYREALQRGLPFPILTAAEYFSLGQEGFAWGAQYRAAGYYGSILLWAAFAMWLMMNLLLVVVPRYGAYCMVLTGALLAVADLVYWALLPARPLLIRLEGGMLSFRLGWCFWLVLAAGALCMLVGLVIAAVDLAFPHRFSTILEVDYDTPYDRHIIIEESHDTRNGKKKSGSRSGSRSLEEPVGAGLGSRILRRLSKRERLEGRHGVVNDAFEMEAPKSPWRYPFPRPIMLRNPHLQRSLSADSGSSVGGDDPCGPPAVGGVAGRARPLSPLAIAAAQAKVAAESGKGAGSGASCSAAAPSTPTSPTSPSFPTSPTAPLSASSSSSGSSFGLTLLHRQGSSATTRAATQSPAGDSPRHSISSNSQAVAMW